MGKRIVFFLCCLCCASMRAQMTDRTGFFMWDEATEDVVIEDAIARDINSFRSRDLTILYTQSAWNVFKQSPSSLDVMVAIPVYYTYTTTPVDLQALADTINNNTFIRRLQVYPKLQPGLMNPSELNPCNDWLTGYADEFEQRIRQIDQLVTDKSVEILVAGQLGTPGCADLTQIVNALYDLQSNGRSVAWAVTVYPYYYGTQDASLQTLTGDIDGVLTNLEAMAPEGKDRLPLRVIETGWPSSCSDKATPENHCEFANSAFQYSHTGVKLYYFELQDFADGWSECEKHFGLYDADGVTKCPSLVTANVSQESDQGVSIYPLPYTNGFLYIEQNNEQEIIRVSLSSIQGINYDMPYKLMDNGRIEADLHGLPKGLYVLHLDYNNGRSSSHLLIQ